MVNQISSKNNRIITYIKSLHDKKSRDINNEFFIEGIRFVEDALSCGVKFKIIIICEEFIASLEEMMYKFDFSNTQIYSVPTNIFSIISDTKSPQGILGTVEKQNYIQDDVIKNSNFILILENLQDPGNLGAIIRTADASGVDSIAVSEGTVDIYNPKVLRSTMGSIFHIPIIKMNNMIEYIDSLIVQKFEVFAAHPYGQKNCYEANMKQKTAIVIGNEANGVSDRVLDKCTQIKIPMKGKAESLNASVAATILMYERLRQNI